MANTKHTSPKAGAKSGSDGKDKGFSVPQIPPLRFPRDGKDGPHYTTWLVVRYAYGDNGSRPLGGGTTFWESPDVWVQNANVINQPVPGQANTVFANISNLGLQDATGVQVNYYWVNPSLAITTANANLIGTGYVNVPAAWTVPLQCPTPWVPVVENGGHECLIAEAFIPVQDPLTSPLNPVDDRHVGQKNEQLVLLKKGEKFSVKVGAANVMGFPQNLTIDVLPVSPGKLHPLLAARQKNLPVKAVPAASVLPLSLKFVADSSFFTGPSLLFAQRLVTETRLEIAGRASSLYPVPQITHSANFEPWESRTVEITGQVPATAVAGQAYAFRVVQRIGRMVTGGYTVNVVVAN